MFIFYFILAKGPSVAREKNFEKKIRIVSSLKHPTTTHECPQKNSAQSVQPFGRLSVTYIHTNVLFYYIDIGKPIQHQVSMIQFYRPEQSDIWLQQFKGKTFL